MGSRCLETTSDTHKKMTALSSILIIFLAITPYCMGSDTPDLTQDFLQNTLEFLYEIDQNQFGNENENASTNVVIKTFRSAVKTFIDECKKSIRKLEFIYEKDKNQQEKENLNGNVANRTITGFIEAVIEESENSVSADFPTFVEGIIFALLLFPLGFIFVPLFAAGSMLVVMSVIMIALPFLIVSSIIFSLLLLPLGVI